MVYTKSNMQLADLKYKPSVRKSLHNLTDRAIGTILYLPSVSLHYQLLCLGKFHGTTHINYEQKKKSNIKDINIQFTQSYYDIPRRSDLKIPRIFSIFISRDVNIQLITIHPRISLLISFICTNTNTR